MRLILAGALACAALSGCATVETTADHARDFVKAHPVATSIVASIAVSSIITVVAMHRAKSELEDEAAAAERGQEQAALLRGALAQ